MSTTFSTSAIVLSRQNINGDSSVLSLFTRQRGKLEVLAKGLRKARSKLAGQLEPITQTEVFIVRGRRHFIVAGSVPTERYLNTHTQLDKIMASGSLCQLIDQCSPAEVADEREDRLLAIGLNLIETLNLNRREYRLLVHCFAWQLINILGYRPDLTACAVCHSALTNEDLIFSARAGGVAHKRCVINSATTSLHISPAAIKGLTLMLTASLADCLKLRSVNGALGEMEAIVEAIIEERFDIPRQARLWLI
jgi:DNA repair protein RecO (recombination protein O)